MNCLNIKVKIYGERLWCGKSVRGNCAAGWLWGQVAAAGKRFYGLSVGSAPLGNSTHISPVCFMLPAWAPAWAPKPQ